VSTQERRGAIQGPGGQRHASGQTSLQQSTTAHTRHRSSGWIRCLHRVTLPPAASRQLWAMGDKWVSLGSRCTSSACGPCHAEARASSKAQTHGPAHRRVRQSLWHRLPAALKYRNAEGIECERTREMLLLPARRLDTIAELRPPEETGASTAAQQQRRRCG